MNNADFPVRIPADVPHTAQSIYVDNYHAVTRGTGRLMLFAGDQKVEHLNSDFYGEGIAQDDNSPEHLFKIASQGKIGVFASQLGLIARYGMEFPWIPYLIKLNSKTNLIKTAQADPISGAWYTMDQIIRFHKNSGLNICGIGYTVYLGSGSESDMLHEAAQLIYDAHQHGYITVLWMYPRGKSIKDEKDPHLIAGAAGVAACLGSDFVKVNYPMQNGIEDASFLKEAVLAAGRTKVVCAGGDSEDVKLFLRKLYDQIHTGGAEGNATGRNIHQKTIKEAVNMCNAVYAITVENQSVEEAYKVYTSGE